ncbi:hypothetical protein KXD40_009399 [Peronospora effusa]|uniref:Nudix hydrolase domain-containing protein n=1 Tax=Peronospora effusa TaxID=542832 RepID=A0A3R7YYY8_9STRA|nr:hypothetical protein DD237_005535 [Peronospora effusa]UIZ28729.1 hypothetical protein KXD40_009399 [Peronospora effusa]
MMENSITNNDLSSNVVVESNKERPTGLYQDLPWNDLKRHSSRLLQSRVGRDKQRYDGKIRLLACIVVSRRPVDSNENEFLLISSSKHPTQWILPKGGWENDESIVESALREANEEAGGNPCRFYGYKLQVKEVFQDWAENTRQRKWVRGMEVPLESLELFTTDKELEMLMIQVSFDEARALLQHRPELVEMVSRAAAL